MEDRELVEARAAETGKPIWAHSYPIVYEDRFGYSPGPRASPVIHEDKVFAHGVTAWLTCLDLESGRVLWKRDLEKEFGVPRYFFGKGSNPIVAGKNLILNVGGGANQCMVGFDLLTGETSWILEDSWGASYSSPVLARFYDRLVCLALTGGESKPPDGGLLILDPLTGEALTRFPWRSRQYESANACPPVPLGENCVFLSECYGQGSIILRIADDFSAEVIWSDASLGIHWMTPVVKDGMIFGVSGRHQLGAEVFCLDWRKGAVLWREPIVWRQEISGVDRSLQLFRGSWLLAQERFWCLSELGSFLRIDLNSEGWRIEQSFQPFFAPETWTMPALSRGLLYLMQNEKDRATGKSSRLLCFDLRQQ